MKKQYDISVIGAGNGGLAAAAYAARAGKKTLLVERHNIPGGCATSFRRGRFEFEPSLHELAGFGTKEQPQEVGRIFQNVGADVTMLDVPDAFRVIIDGGDYRLPTGRADFCNAMEGYVPGCKKSVEDFFGLADECAQAIQYLSGPAIDLDEMKERFPNFMYIANAPLKDVLDALNMPVTAQKIMSTYWSYMAMPPSFFDFTMYAYMLERYVDFGATIPKDRSHELSCALADSVRRNGGEVWFGTEVSKILVENGQAKGVVINGEKIYSEHIICNVHPHVVFGRMMDAPEIPAWELKRANARQLGVSGFTVYLGLNKTAEELGITDYSTFINGTGDIEQGFLNMDTIDQNDYQITNCLNISNPGCSPEGTCIVWLTQLCRGSAWAGITPQQYKKKKNETAARLIRQYEEATGVTISDAIEEISISTPVTFARYLGTPDGAIYGYQGLPWDTMLARTMTFENEGYIKGLRFGGGFTTRMDGYSSAYATGTSAAKMTLADIEEGR